MASEKVMGVKELKSRVKSLAKPVDFEKLEALGILSKAGEWYRIHKMGELPRHVSEKIYAMQSDSRGIKVKFHKASKVSKLKKVVEKL